MSDLSISSIWKKRETNGPTDGPTDRPTDGRTDIPTYRDARTHLKSYFLWKRDGPTDWWTDTPSYRVASTWLKRVFDRVSLRSLSSHQNLMRFFERIHPYRNRHRNEIFPKKCSRISNLEFVISRVQRNSISHFVGPSVRRTVVWEQPIWDINRWEISMNDFVMKSWSVYQYDYIYQLLMKTRPIALSRVRSMILKI